MTEQLQLPPYICWGKDAEDLTAQVRENAAVGTTAAVTVLFARSLVRFGRPQKQPAEHIYAVCSQKDNNVFYVPVPVPD